MQWWASRILKRFPVAHHVITDVITVHKGSDMPPGRIAFDGVHVGERYLQENYPINYAGFLTQLMGLGTHSWNSQGFVVFTQYDDDSWDDSWVYRVEERERQMLKKARDAHYKDLIQAKGRAIREPKKVRDEK